MKTIALVLAAAAILFLAGFSIVGCSPKSDHAHQYTCPMKEHADVISDKPGKCPKCGMKLVEKH